MNSSQLQQKNIDQNSPDILDVSKHPKYIELLNKNKQLSLQVDQSIIKV